MGPRDVGAAAQDDDWLPVVFSQMRVLSALFKALDENEDGSISLGELRNGLEKLNWDLTPRTKKLLDQISDRYVCVCVML